MVFGGCVRLDNEMKINLNRHSRIPELGRLMRAITERQYPKVDRSL
jgi:hypothetical protein